MNSDWKIAPDEDEDELDDYGYLSSSKDTILFCIDASVSMHQPRTSETKGKKTQKSTRSHFHSALQCVINIMKRKVIVGPGDSVGVMFFNTEERKGDEVLANHYLFQPVGPIGVDPIQNIMDIVEAADEDPETLLKMFKPKPLPSVSIGDTFGSCNHVLRRGAPKTAIKRIFYITDEDKPTGSSGPAAKRLEDLANQGIVLEPFFISTDDRPFDIQRFYADVLFPSSNEDDGEFTYPSVCSGFEQVIAEMRIREMPKRSMWSIPFKITEGLVIGVKGYGLVIEQKKGTYKYMSASGETTEEAVSRTVYFDKDQQTEINSADIVYGVRAGEIDEYDESDAAPVLGPDATAEGSDTEDEDDVKPKIEVDEDEDVKPKRAMKLKPKPRQQVYFTAEQRNSFRTLNTSPSIKLLGFKDSDELQFEDNIKHAYFIYPNEDAFTGSTRTFSALLKSMAKKEKIGIALCVLRRNSTPVFCALLPQEETLDDSGVQINPPGIHLIPLPFTDEIRESPISRALRGDEEQADNEIAVMQKIIGKLKAKNGYQPDAYPNPALNLHNAQLEAAAFNIGDFDPDDPAQFRDKTLPMSDKIQERCGSLIKEWKELLLEDRNTNTTVPKSNKRVAAVDVDEYEFRSRNDSGTLNKFKVEQLKAFLSAKGLKIAGLKADLIERVSEWLDSHQT